MLPMSTPQPPQRLTLRDQQKADTRARVVDAARALFVERGYEAATIRDIAERAGVAPGSVFTTFASKEELLHEIIHAKYDELSPRLAEAAQEKGSAQARIIALGRVAYAFEVRELRLVAEALGASWTWSPESEAQNRRRLTSVLTPMAEILDQGQKSGELDPEADALLVLDALFACYLRNFRRALFDQWDAERLASHFSRQAALILAGCRA